MEDIQRFTFGLLGPLLRLGERLATLLQNFDGQRPLRIYASGMCL